LLWDKGILREAVGNARQSQDALLEFLLDGAGWWIWRSGSHGFGHY